MSGIYKAHSAHELTKNSRGRDGPLGFLFHIYIPTLPPHRSLYKSDGYNDFSDCLCCWSQTNPAT